MLKTVEFIEYLCRIIN